MCDQSLPQNAEVKVGNFVTTYKLSYISLVADKCYHVFGPEHSVCLIVLRYLCNVTVIFMILNPGYQWWNCGLLSYMKHWQQD